MHGLEGNKVFAAILFGIFVALAVVFVPRILGEVDALVAFVQDPEHNAHHDQDYCDPDTGKHGIIPGFCLIPESPKPQAPVMPFLLQLASVDASAGEGLTQRTCGGCHVFTQATGPAKAGPNLWGVVGASAGVKDSYASYSSAITGADVEWDYEQLNGFLAGPSAWMPGTKMSYAGQPDQLKRAIYIGYLRTLSDNPLPLPNDDELAALQAQYDADLVQFEADLAAWEAGE